MRASTSTPPATPSSGAIAGGPPIQSFNNTGHPLTPPDMIERGDRRLVHERAIKLARYGVRLLRRRLLLVHRSGLRRAAWRARGAVGLHGRQFPEPELRTDLHR